MQGLEELFEQNLEDSEGAGIHAIGLTKKQKAIQRRKAAEEGKKGPAADQAVDLINSGAAGDPTNPAPEASRKFIRDGLAGLPDATDNLIAALGMFKKTVVSTRKNDNAPKRVTQPE